MRSDNPPCVRFVKLLDVRFASSITFLYLCSDETKMNSETGLYELLELKNISGISMDKENKIILYQDDNEITRVALRFAD